MFTFPLGSLSALTNIPTRESIGVGLRISFMGEGLVLAAALQCARDRIHDVVGLFATSAAEAEPLSRLCPCITPDMMTPFDFADRHPADVLISAANRYVLDPATLSRPRLGCVNYHNGPLPNYAGLRATAWAVLNGEAAHGVTWHRIDAGIDTGPILSQRVFDIDPEETTASLNARCTAAAIGCLDDVFARIEKSDLSGLPQRVAGRSYFGRDDVVPDAGLIDWHWPSERILRLVRACDWGPTANDFGTAAVAFRGIAAFVRSAHSAAASAPAGQVVACDGVRVTVGCGDGAVTVELDRSIDIQPGQHLDVHDGATRSELAAWHRRALRQETQSLPALLRLKARSERRGPESAVSLRASPADIATALAAADGRNAVLAVQTPATIEGLCQRWLPYHFATATLTDRVSLPGDLHLRRPEFAWADGWAARASASAHSLGDGVYTVRCRAIRMLAEDLVRELAGRTTPALEAPRPTVVELLDRLAAVNPAAPALQVRHEAISRGDLQRRSSAIAAALIQAGLRLEDGVGLYLPAGIDFVVCALGAMRAGAAYVPLDIAAPPLRLMNAIADAGITHVLAHGPVLDAFSGITVIDVNETYLDERGVLPTPDPNRCAYRIFTSGSTGRPKAVEVEHAGLSNLIAHYGASLGLGPGTRWPMLASTVFDASTADVWPTLAHGGVVLIPTLGLLIDADGLIAWLCAERVTAAFVPTAVAERLLDRDWPRGMALRTLLTGGDTLHRRPPPGLPFQLLNTYGPTENTIDSLWHRVEPGSGQPPIGCPIGGVSAYILDDDGRPVAPGETGELTLGGLQLARGYRGQPALTARAFEPDPRALNRRRYRTGDRVSRNSSGVVSFHGRRDDQVQLRGLRVELGEIEAMAKAEPRVAQAACVPERSGTEIIGLAIFIVIAPGQLATAADLGAWFEQHLPPALRPRSIIITDYLPFTPTGKLDRAALAVQRLTSAPNPEPNGDPVLVAWSRHVRPASDGEPADFWSSGGDSLAVLTMLLEIESTTGVRVSLGSFIAAPTLQELQRLVAARAKSTLIELAPGRGPPIVCWYAAAGDLGPYRHLLRGLTGRRVVGLISPGLSSPDHRPASIEEAVTAGLAALDEAGIIEAAAMLGYSWAGLLAFEAVRQLRAQGRVPPYLALIGSVPPAGPGTALFRNCVRLGRTVAKIARNVVKAPFTGRSPFQQLETWSALERHHRRLGRAYRPKGKVLVQAGLFRELVDSGLTTRLKRLLTYEDMGWRWWMATPVKLTWLEHDHRTIIKADGAATLAPLILEAVSTTIPC